MAKSHSLTWYLIRLIALGFVVFGFATVYYEFTFFVKGQGTYEFHQLHLVAALTAILVGGLIIQRQDLVVVVGLLKDAFAAIRPGIKIGGRRETDPKPGSPEATAMKKADRIVPPADADP